MNRHTDMAEKYDIAVAWRIYPGVSKTPLIHGDNKLQLVTTCLRSFVISARGLRVSYYFILDGCPPAYRHMIEGLGVGGKLTFIELPGEGNLATFARQVEILRTQEDADIVYFAEDDYLYVPDQFHKLVDLIRTGRCDFASCYLHRDIFTHPIHDHKRRVMYEADTCWLQVSSTCLTFITSRSTLQQTAKVLLTYSKGNNDCAMWLVLTKTHIWNPWAWIRYLRKPDCAGIMKVAVKRSFLYFFLPRRYSLYVPFPAIGTHLEKGCESPGADWVKLAGEIDNYPS